MDEASETAENTYESVTREYQEFLGDDAEPLISSLRSGEDLSYEKDGETMTVENKTGAEQKPQDVHYALALAEEELGNEAELNEIANFLYSDDGVLQKRADGQEWDQIYTEHGFEMDAVIGAELRNSQASINSNSNAQASADSIATADSVPADMPEDARTNQKPDDAGVPDNWENDADLLEDEATPRAEIADRGDVPRNQQ